MFYIVDTSKLFVNTKSQRNADTPAMIPQHQQLNKLNYFNFMPFSPSLLKLNFDMAANMLLTLKSRSVSAYEIGINIYVILI